MSHPGASTPDKRLNHEEYRLVKAAFVQVFDDMMLYYDQEEVDQIAELLGEITANYRFHKFSTARSLEEWAKILFQTADSVDFILELTDRFSVEITSIKNEAFACLINVLAIGTSVSKAVKADPRFPHLVPIIESFGTTEDKNREIYLQHPWLVICTMISLEFRRTSLGSKVKTEKK